MKTNNPTKKAEIAADWIGDGLLLAARRLREVQDKSPHLLPATAKFLKIGLRRAYYLARFDRTFRELGVDENRLAAIGWPKLRLLADYIEGSNCDYLLDLAEKSSLDELSLIVRHEGPIRSTRCITLYLTPPQYEVFAEAVTMHGAVKVGRELANKERALISALSSTKGALH